MVPGKGISMQDKKQNKIKLQIIFSILIFTVVFTADFYAMINFSEEYLLIAAITVILLICLWGVLNGIFSLRALKEQRSEEQYDSVFKSEKASYLMLKKYFEEIEEKIDILQKSSKIPTEEIINAQKAIAKVVINRNRENADAIMGSNEQLMETIEEYENKIKEGKDFIVESQKNAIYENLKEISEKQQSLSDSIKEMEIRLSQAITANPIQFTANVEMPKGMQVAEQTVTAETPEQESDSREIIEPEKVTEPVAQPKMADLQVENMPGHDIMDDISIKVPDNMEAQSVESEPVVDETPVEEPEEPKAPKADTSDPNRQLNPDEIAALFAGMQGGTAAPSKEEKEELSAEESPAPAEEQPAAEKPKAAEAPKAPAVDMSDPNRNLTPDEIAALIGNL